MISLVDAYGFLLDEPWCVPLADALRLTDFQILYLYNPPRDRKTGARRQSPAIKGWWRREDVEATKVQFFAMGAALKFSPDKLEEAWRQSQQKRKKRRK